MNPLGEGVFSSHLVYGLLGQMWELDCIWGLPCDDDVSLVGARRLRDQGNITVSEMSTSTFNSPARRQSTAPVIDDRVESKQGSPFDCYKIVKFVRWMSMTRRT